jgi:hypothetical protein
MIVEMARQSSVFFDDDDFDDDADDDESDDGKADGILGSDEAGKGHRSPRWSQNWKYEEKNWEDKVNGAVFEDDSDGEGNDVAAHAIDNISSDEETRTKASGPTVLG